MEHTAPARDAAIPSWLQTACQQIRDPEQLRQGVQAFFQMTGKSPEHVARVVRQTLHTTPRDMVTEARMAHAAVLLDMTPQAIIDIANDCGYESLSRFYRVFKGAYNMTPRQYRRRMIGGSG
jgi:AraC family cel operon transcriptional repressor